MTIRAILLGLLGGAAVCGLSYFNDAVMRQTPLVSHHMPISVYGGLILFILLMNPVLFAVYKRLALTGKELAVILTLTLAACAVPAGLVGNLAPPLILPHHYARTQPGWREHKVIEMVPKQMLADVSKDEGVALNGFVRGLAVGDKHISVFDIPWYAWSRTLSFWLPLALALWIALIGLAVVVHRQWSDYEQLPYPIAQFANSLLPKPGTSQGSVFRSGLFWVPAATLVVMYLNNYACQWFPQDLIPVPTQFEFERLFREVLPDFLRGPHWHLRDPTIFFTVVALAYFLPSDVSFSVGVGPYLYCYILGLLAGYGLPVRSGGLQFPHIESFLLLGSYFAMLMVLIYTGRHYYSNVFRRAVFLSSREELERQSIWGARVFLLGTAVFVANLIIVGLDWPFAVLYTAILVMLFVVMGRIIAETGLFFNAPRLYPGALILGIFGAQALGPEILIIMFMLSVVLAFAPGGALMPFLTNGLKVIELQRERIGKVALWCGVTVVLGLAVALPVTFYFQYDRGANMADIWGTRRVPQSPFVQIMRIKQRLIAQGKLEHSESLTTLQRLKEISPKRSCMISFAISAGLVLVFTAARLRFARWPIHPVVFLVWHTYSARWFAASFFIGWFVKAAVTKYGGSGTYQKLKPVMFGLIAGEMLGNVIPIIIGFVYYQTTGELPKSFSIFP